jgi:hypothetical protein
VCSTVKYGLCISQIAANHCCQANFKALKYENRDIKNFTTLAAPQNEKQSLPNFVCSLLVKRFNFSTLIESQ